MGIDIRIEASQNLNLIKCVGTIAIIRPKIDMQSDLVTHFVDLAEDSSIGAAQGIVEGRIERDEIGRAHAFVIFNASHFQSRAQADVDIVSEDDKGLLTRQALIDLLEHRESITGRL